MKSLLLSAVILFSLGTNAQNYSLKFNGSSQYITIPDQNSVDLSANFTLEGWVYPTGAGSQATQGGMIINKENSYEIARFTDGTLQYALSANGMGSDWGWINSGIVLPLNAWSHFAMVKSGSTVSFYLNGVLGYTNSTVPATLTANTELLRLANRNGAHYFDGNMDEIRIWNTARTQTELKTYMLNRSLANNASGLVAYYRMNENSGSTTVNACTNVSGLDGTLIGTPTWNASPVQYKLNSLSFDGTNDVVNIADNINLHITTAITLEALVYATSTSSIQNVVCKSSNAANNGYIFPRTDDGWNNVVGYLHIGGAFRTISAAYPSRNAWHHLALTYDGANMKLYIDGTLANSLAQTGVISVNSNVLALGNQTGFSEYFGGYADEVRIWNVARTQAQIQAAQQIEIDPTAQTGLVSYYTFNQGVTGGTNTGLTTVADQKGSNNGSLNNFAFSGAASNFVPQYTTLGALPVSWLSFTAQKKDASVILNWSTASEHNSRNYTVQHSLNGVSWNSIGSATAAGNSSVVQQYSFTHSNPDNGINYYRILQTDIDGKVSYSKAISLQYRNQNPQTMIFPNPVTGGLLHLQLQQPAMVSVYNNAGTLILRKQLPAGSQQLNMTGFAKGVYQLRVGTTAEQIVLQ
ncbi:MAG: LamG-like jellyroll fold domain-containing protein [Chitinophagaceae bacterium]